MFWLYSRSRLTGGPVEPLVGIPAHDLSRVGGEETRKFDATISVGGVAFIDSIFGLLQPVVQVRQSSWKRLVLSSVTRSLIL